TGGQSTAAAQTAPAADRVVVFPADQAATLLTQCSRQVPGPVQGTWVPDAPIVARIESVIEAALVQALEKTGPPAESRHPIREYYRQYGGLVVGGRRLVYVNAFHERHLELPGKLRAPRAPFDWREGGG